MNNSNNTITLRSGAKIHKIKKKDLDNKCYLTRAMLSQMHLSPVGDPVAYDISSDGSTIYYFDPSRVKETPPELWYKDTTKPREEMTLESGTVIERMSVRRAASYGYYTEDRLKQMMYEVHEEPVAYTYKGDKSILYLYDKKTAVRLPLNCIRCNKEVRYRRKLCRACYEEEMAHQRVEGDAHRHAYYGMDPSRVLFFDLELTGVYDHDEIISISIVDGNEQLIMDTLIRPVHKKKWKRTEKIHGITPAMVQDAPTLAELTPKIKELFQNADNLIAYGVSTDYSHIKYIYETEAERDALRDKTRCCANEFVRFIHEHRPDVLHASLVDAMACFGIDWDGIPHSSVADTFACCRVWHKLFPRYYLGEEEASLDVPSYPVPVHNLRHPAQNDEEAEEVYAEESETEDEEVLV